MPECSGYVEDECFGDNECSKRLACSKFYNPVYDSQGIFYPSACWAEQLGIDNYQYGYSNRLEQFYKDLWQTPDFFGNSYEVPKPNIEFTYT